MLCTRHGRTSAVFLRVFLIVISFNITSKIRGKLMAQGMGQVGPSFSVSRNDSRECQAVQFLYLFMSKFSSSFDKSVHYHCVCFIWDMLARTSGANHPHPSSGANLSHGKGINLPHVKGTNLSHGKGTNLRMAKGPTCPNTDIFIFGDDS